MTEYSRVALSALDVAPVWTGSSATRSLRDTIALAQRLEQLDYARFWVAEHHGVPSLATSATAVLVAAVAGATTTMRVGSGGVLLPNHPPLVVAEQFGTLAALHPDRIDLGVGRAPGSADPTTARLLRRGGESDADFLAQIAELTGYFAAGPGEPAPSPQSGVAGEHRPPMVILGSSPSSARMAGALGLPYAYAHHINATATVESLAAYRESFQPSARFRTPYAIVAALVFADDTDEAARELAAPLLVGQVRMRSGRMDSLFPTPRQAADFSFTEAQREWARDRLERQIWGSPERVRERVTELVRATGADELMALTMVYDPERRIHSYELLSETVGRV
ncbi:LLM class flavin-dependent oxidoreductase [Kutzneria sp. CA-103260]|uniref:LLM class flavin-dependent oxidoreductase n=1 Tax=Kutzneria sp. CA-103260 TaxID=2802641 RepID=UPI001BEE572E|nr:LLM class flavin-dependent oxidoreductase [Kutzneria sp. CA-103260]QUQ68678.1 FMN-linked alkanal monooxygenase [Kutzneria sp. CA-103260]